MYHVPMTVSVFWIYLFSHPGISSFAKARVQNKNCVRLICVASPSNVNIRVDLNRRAAGSSPRYTSLGRGILQVCYASSSDIGELISIALENVLFWEEIFLWSILLFTSYEDFTGASSCHRLHRSSEKMLSCECDYGGALGEGKMPWRHTS